MADKLTKQKRSLNMSKIRARNTIPEIKVRSALHKMGFRFRLNIRKMPGKPDIVLKKYNKIIFVNGCFWHQHEDCIDGHLPKSNSDYWEKKLERNIKRDNQNIQKLRDIGWNVNVIWECETKDESKLLEIIKEIMLR